MDEKRILKEGALVIAKKMKASGIDDEAIKKMTGLKLGEIKKL